MEKLIFITELNREFEEMIEGCVMRVLMETKLFDIHTLAERDEPQMNILNIDAISKLVGYSKATIYSKLSLGHIPYLARGKPLLFSREDIEKWIRAGRPKTNSTDKIDKILKNKHRD